MSGLGREKAGEKAGEKISKGGSRINFGNFLQISKGPLIYKNDVQIL
jgi:hypothetical protein